MAGQIQTGERFDKYGALLCDATFSGIPCEGHVGHYAPDAGMLHFAGTESNEMPNILLWADGICVGRPSPQSH